MSIFHKIASILLLPLMLLSFTGASLHVHVCGHNGAIFTDIHFTGISHEDHSKSCCIQEEEIHHCGDTSCEMSGKQHESTCCLDLQKKIVTDKNFSPSIKSIKFSPNVLELAGIMSGGITENSILCEICPPDFLTAWVPPPIQSRTVLIL